MGPRTQTQFAAASGYQPPSTTMGVRQFEAAGFVVRKPSLTDGCANIVELSDQAWELLPKVKAAWLQLAEETVSGLSSTHLDQLSSALSDLAANLTRMGGFG